jgi:peptidyl-prolyl cis-trans isomerase SurA
MMARLFSGLRVAVLVLLAAMPARAQTTTIVATVNGDVISRGDVINRARLFGMSSGIGMSPDAVARMAPQVVRQLIDEKLRLQEAQRRHIVISDKQIADAVREVETRNNLPPGALQAKLAADGVSFSTLVDQIRVQLGWTQVLKQQLGDSVQQVTDADVAEQEALLKAQAGKPEYRVGEIFIPITDPAHAAEAQRFAETIIGQLRGGAPFAVIAAQFSQSQNALQGGDLGWVQPSQLDPEVARVVAAMPERAISNPLAVPGGFAIVTLYAKRTIGETQAGGVSASIRQIFLPFTSPLNPAAPTEQQQQTLAKGKALSASLHSCAEVEAAAKANNSPRPADPGDVILANVNPPQFRQLLSTLPEGKATQPLVSADGVAVMMVCSRGEHAAASESAEQIRQRLLGERIELVSRQMLRDLQRRAVIEIRNETPPPAPASGKKS